MTNNISGGMIGGKVGGRVGGIIAEYDPLHNGHAYHISETKKLCGGVVVAMSPNVCQRGSFSRFDKFLRAEAAVSAGADLVLEMPSAAVLSGAEDFAVAGVEILSAVGVGLLSFGSECGDKEYLKRALEVRKNLEASGEIPVKQAEGLSYPRALGELLEREGINLGANDILALEYMRAMPENTEFFALKRRGADHNGADADTSGGFASASYLRENGLDRRYMPEYSCGLFENAPEFSAKALDDTVLSYLKRLSPGDIEKASFTEDGLSNRIYEALRNSETLEEALFAAKTKRYSLARLRRIYLSLFLGFKKGDEKRIPYIRVLALNEKGAEILSKCKKTSPIPIITSLAAARELGEDAAYTAEKEAFVTDMFRFLRGYSRICGADFRHSPRIIHK